MASGIGNTAGTDLLTLIFQNTAWANVGNAGGLLPSSVAGSFYIALSTGTLSATSTQSTTETTYTNYVRVAVARSSAGWTISGTAPEQSANAAAVTFATCGASGATVTDASIGRDSSSTGEVLFWGALASSLAISNGITPSFAIGQLKATVI